MNARHRRYGGTSQTALSDYIADHADEWAAAWLNEVRQEETTSHYRVYPHLDELVRDTAALYHYLALWLRTGEWDPRIDPHYQRIGRDRRAAGFPLSEVISAILLAKRHLWNGIIASRLLSQALELEASKAISLFYDKAIYHTIAGYEGRETGPAA
ncbi:MAG TPA: RsbRD N-terminal domain-containing protein [Gemmatimonadota bacterium]|nr:RsbRD N-terminal domain-containing protein [Gemmatimonadota bacterium]